MWVPQRFYFIPSSVRAGSTMQSFLRCAKTPEGLHQVRNLEKTTAKHGATMIYFKNFGRFITYIPLLDWTYHWRPERHTFNYQVGEQILSGRYVHVPRPGAAFDICSLRKSKAALEEVTKYYNNTIENR